MFLNVFFFASALLFCEMHAGVFFREFVSHRVEGMLPEGSAVDIGSIKGGIFRNFTVEGVRILPKAGGPALDIERAEVNYKLWYPLLKHVPALSSPSGERKVMLFLGNENNDFLSGFLELKRKSGALDINGYAEFNNKEKFFIKGKIEGNKPSRFRITRKGGSIDLLMENKTGGLEIKGNINHFQFNDLDLIGECVASVSAKDGHLTNIHLVFKNIIVNYTPFEKDAEFFLSYEKGKETLNITKFKIGDEIEGYGYLRTALPHYMFLNWTITDLRIEEYFGGRDLADSISGVMNGSFTLKGPAREARVTAHLDVQNGNINDLVFDSIIGNLKGKIPVVDLHDSRICKEDGYIMLGGFVDFSKMKDNKAFETIEYGPGENFFIWEGWSVIKRRRDSSVKAEKPIDKEFTLSFEARTEKEIEQEEHFLSVEHKVKF